MAKSETHPKTQPARKTLALPPPRTPRSRVRTTLPKAALSPAVLVTTVPARVPAHPARPFGEAQRRWFEREVATLRRLAQTERLAGDFVAAQRLERELDSFIVEATALMEGESTV